MKFSFSLILCFLSFSLFAKSPQQRVELMKYVIKQESKMRTDTKWDEVSWYQKIKLIEDAYAYKEGESCLILGFKSHFTNGMCRLSAAEGVSEYRKQCEGTDLPCNPQVFGKPSSDKPFCIAKASGRELSKSCAKKTFEHLASTSKSEALKDIEKQSIKEFNLDKIDLSQIDEALSQAMQSIFKSEDSDLEAAIKFTKELCEDLKLATQTGHQPLDVKTCQSHLALLEKGKLPAKAKEEEKEEDPKEKEKKTEEPDAPEKVDVEGETHEVAPLKKMISADPAVKKEEECVEPALDKKLDDNIKDVKKVTDAEEPKAWLACINKIEAHKIVAPKIKDINEFSKEWGRYYGYWHNLDGQKQFGIQCNPKSDDDTHEVFTFLSPTGFTQVKAPANEHTGLVIRMTSKAKEYYIVQPMIGDYFEVVDKAKIKTATSGTQEDVRAFLKKGPGSVAPLLPVAEDQLDQAKMCVRQRIDEYADWITYPTGILPNVKEYNADIGVYNSTIGKGLPGEELKKKYTRSVEQVKKDMFAEMMTDLPECQGILSEEDFSKQYDKDHAERIKLYNQMRGYLGMNKTN